jgi:hypothetical protein
MAAQPEPFELDALLERDATAILDEAAGALERSHLPHYEEIGSAERRRRLDALFQVVRVALRERDLVPVLDYAQQVAEERFAAGVGIAEVQTAFNVLEEVLWRRVVATANPDQLADAIGLLSTVLGTGKDNLARTYVALATKTHVPSLDLTALFRGGG